MKSIAIALAMLVGTVNQASALSIDVNFAEVGNSVVISYDGAFDTTGLSSSISGGISSGVDPSGPEISSPGGAVINTRGYTIGPAVDFSFGTSGFQSGAISSGDRFRIFNAVGTSRVAFKVDYMSGDLFAGSLTYENTTLAALGIEVSPASFALNENNTLRFSVAAPVPLPASFYLILIAMAGLGFVARQKQRNLKYTHMPRQV